MDNEETGRFFFFFFDNMCYEELAAMFLGSCLVLERGVGGYIVLKAHANFLPGPFGYLLEPWSADNMFCYQFTLTIVTKK